MLRMKEAHLRWIIWFMLLFGNTWISQLMTISANLQTMTADWFLRANSYLMHSINWQLNTMFVLALSLSFWPLFLPYLLNQLLKLGKKAPLPKIHLVIFSIWIILTLSFIFVQQGPL